MSKRKRKELEQDENLTRYELHYSDMLCFRNKIDSRYLLKSKCPKCMIFMHIIGIQPRYLYQTVQFFLNEVESELFEDKFSLISSINENISFAYPTYKEDRMQDFYKIKNLNDLEYHDVLKTEIIET